ncbi:MaoC/PaaZ C-terminal domain-containing protein [Streptomyces chitinivorans]|uniref:MaoC/PaaZ C-terminal domain-containing protein n=1 Tax=Streptomyces chitinivorans TaxID=1257027 RepID=UPI0024492A20|nr:MaoC/PaaZ C-terminal domain-containing protein [Streptomyces chitinivorans]MDH2411572.1 MaoC/PaaZ C-terminal domain-containing protein [Streptomyces chitinivorans]
MRAPAAGERLPTRVFRISRADLVRYAAASGDHNPIHWSDSRAAAAGLPGVIAHGMLSMGLAATAVAEWAGERAVVTEYGTRFTRPVVVPDTADGVELTVDGTVGEVREDGTARVDLTVRCGARKVLARTRVLLMPQERQDGRRPLPAG